MRITAAGAMDALTFLPPLNVVVEGETRSTLESGMLVSPSPKSRSQQYINVASEVGSHI